MSQVRNQEEMELGMTYLNNKDICYNFWSKLRSDNSDARPILKKGRGN